MLGMDDGEMQVEARNYMGPFFLLPVQKAVAKGKGPFGSESEHMICSCSEWSLKETLAPS